MVQGGRDQKWFPTNFDQGRGYLARSNVFDQGGVGKSTEDRNCETVEILNSPFDTMVRCSVKLNKTHKNMFNDNWN